MRTRKGLTFWVPIAAALWNVIKYLSDGDPAYLAVTWSILAFVAASER